MRKIAAILLFFLFAVAASYALEIRGEVITLWGKPIKGAVILHRSSQRQVITDENGEFMLSLPESRVVVLEIIHPDYIEQELTLSSSEIGEKIVVRMVPLIRQREEVVVTALRYPETSAKVPAAESVISEETLQERMSPNITQGLQEVPGVSSLGAGGFSIVPNIRGLARRRVLILVNNARITSERRTGPNASFVDPRDVEKIEVLRSPSSVFYGSDAIGGVIHIFTKRPTRQRGIGGQVSLKYGTVNQEKGFGLSLQGKKSNTGFYLSFHGYVAENYSSPLGKVLMSEFSKGSLVGRISYASEKREIDFSFLGARGYDIGKPNRESQEEPTWYPLESQNLLQFRWLERGFDKEGELDLQVFLNPHSLETIKERLDIYKIEESFNQTESVDFGFHLSYGRKLDQSIRVKGGADFFGRTGAKAKSVDTYFDPSGNTDHVLEGYPYSEGQRGDIGFFLSVDYTGIKDLDLVGGVRLDFIKLEALPGESTAVQQNSHTAFTGFLGGSVTLSETVIVFANLSRAFRAPSLNELFYTGITGRGFIISNADLLPEISFNLDGGLRFINERFFIGLYAFYYKIDDLIERFLEIESVYTYRNVNKGDIRGFEVEAEFYPIPGWKVFGNFFSFSGRSQKTDKPLNDIPASRFYLGTRLWIGHFSTEINALIQARKENPGPAEITVPSYGVVNVKVSYSFAPWLDVYLHLSNLFNKAYLARPDPESIEEPGRNFIIGINYTF